MSEKKHGPRVWVDHDVYEGREGQSVECFLKAVTFTDAYCPVSELAEAQAEVARLREALESAKADIIRAALDTLWHGPVETTVDMIDNALDAGKEPT